ncbi:MAG TPA: hypothetical protein VF316_12205 [Polyangiaceae bacterium]
MDGRERFTGVVRDGVNDVAVVGGNNFSVTVKTRPSSPTQKCTVTGGADVTSVAVACTTGTFAIGGQISGLSGAVDVTVRLSPPLS